MLHVLSCSLVHAAAVFGVYFCACLSWKCAQSHSVLGDSVVLMHAMPSLGLACGLRGTTCGLLMFADSGF